MPPFDPIEISDDEGRTVVKTQTVPPPRPIRAFAIVADINVRLEETNSTIQAYKDDVTRLKELLRSAEARLEKEQEKRLKLIEQKSKALDSGVTEINARSGLGNGASVEVKNEVKNEPKEENLASAEKPRSVVRQRSIFMGVQIPSRNASPAASASAPSKPVKIEAAATPAAREQVPPPQPRRSTTPPQAVQSNGGFGDDSDGNVPMDDYDSGDNYVSTHQSPAEVHQPEAREKTIPATRGDNPPTSSQGASNPVIRIKIPRPVPTRAKSWRGGGNFGRTAGSQRSNVNIPRNSEPFSRIVIHSAIGGQLQHTWPTPVPGGDYAIKVTRYCCLRRELNWCLPPRPGESEKTLMFATRPFDWGQKDFPLFIREDASKWKYYGDYKITECYNVPLQQWRGFTKTQKTTWCKHMLTRGWGKSVLAKHFSEKELRSMDSSDWEKVLSLFEQEDTNPRHLRITARHLEFVRYNRELYDLLVEKSASNPSIKDLRPQASEKRKAVHDDDAEIGFPDDDYTEQLSSDGDGAPLRKRSRRKRSLISRVEPDSDSDDEDAPLRGRSGRCIEPDSDSDVLLQKRSRRRRSLISRIEPGSDSEGEDVQQAPRATPRATPHRAPSPSASPVTQAREAPTPGVKEELLDDDDLYSAPPKSKPTAASRNRLRVHPSPNRDSNRDSSVEMWEVEPGPWVLPTEDNDKIAASDEPFKKFDANQLIRVWKPCIGLNLPKFPTTMFSRRFLSKYLGGCEQQQECTISEAKKRTQIYKLDVYYCERAEWAPDMPEKPGAHGVVYATKSSSGPVDFNFTNYPVFCRRRANEWEYCGEYQITRRDFVHGEWSRVSPIAKKSWSEGFAGKRGKWGIAHMLNIGIITPGQKVTPQDVLQFIDDGLLQLECQVYKCVGYNREFYDILETKWGETMRAGFAMKQEVLDDDDDD